MPPKETPIPSTWPGVAGKALHLYGAAGVMVVALGWFGWQMIERSDRRTDQLMLEQKEASTANLRLTVESTKAITESAQAFSKVSESVEANTRATEATARAVEDLSREIRDRQN